MVNKEYFKNARSEAEESYSNATGRHFRSQVGADTTLSKKQSGTFQCSALARYFGQEAWSGCQCGQTPNVGTYTAGPYVPSSYMTWSNRDKSMALSACCDNACEGITPQGGLRNATGVYGDDVGRTMAIWAYVGVFAGTLFNKDKKKLLIGYGIVFAGLAAGSMVGSYRVEQKK